VEFRTKVELADGPHCTRRDRQRGLGWALLEIFGRDLHREAHLKDVLALTPTREARLHKFQPAHPRRELVNERRGREGSVLPDPEFELVEEKMVVDSRIIGDHDRDTPEEDTC